MFVCTGYAAQGADTPLAPFSFNRRDPGPRDVEIEILYCGVCHSDLHTNRNEWRNSVFPTVTGHEIVGRVGRVGAEVTKFKPGDLAGVGCLVDSCRSCDNCTRGLEQYCLVGPTGTYNSPDPHTGTMTYGGYSQAIVVDEDFVLRIPDNLDPAAVAPLLCAGITVWTPMREHGVGAGSKVAVVGLGGLGHMGVKLAVALGAQVTVITTSPAKVDDARALGAHEVLLSTDPKAMMAAINRFDFILDTIPSKHNVNPYLMLLGTRGVLVVVGAIDLLEPVHGGLLIRNNRKLAGSLIGGLAATQDLLDFCAEHRVLPQCELIAIDTINEAYARLQANDVKYRFVIDMASLARA